MNHDITNEVLTEFSTAFSSNPVNHIAMNAVTSAGLLAASKNPMAQRESRHSYSISLEQGEITNQKQSGRCWMFAALNTFRFEVMKNLNLKTFELSQNYTLFYDKLEKSNYFLESILETLDEPTQGRLISFLLSAPLGDGGQWDMLCNLVRKYGVVPKEAMPETVASSATREMTAALTRKLREDACRLRKAYADGSTLDELRKKKEAMMEEIYRILCICLGEPPKTFDLEVTDKDDKFIRDTNLTGTAFFEKYVGLNLDDYVSLINAPTADKPYHRSYSVKFLGNVKEGCPVRYLNLPIDALHWQPRRERPFMAITARRSLLPSTPKSPAHFSAARIWTSRPSRSRVRSSWHRFWSWQTPLWISSRPVRRSRKTVWRSLRTLRPFRHASSSIWPRPR